MNKSKQLSYIKEWRMTKAKQLLKNEKLPVGEICELIGYMSPSAINIVFKNTFGISPNKFRKLHLGNYKIQYDTGRAI